MLLHRYLGRFEMLSVFYSVWLSLALGSYSLLWGSFFFVSLTLATWYKAFVLLWDLMLAEAFTISYKSLWFLLNLLSDAKTNLFFLTCIYIYQQDCSRTSYCFLRTPMDTMSYATNESRDNICNLMDLINLITYCCLVLLPRSQDWSSFEDMGPWADPHTRCYSAGRDWS